MGVSQNLGYLFLGVPIIRIIVFWGLYWGPLVLGNYQIVVTTIVVVIMIVVIPLQRLSPAHRHLRVRHFLQKCDRELVKQLL